MPFNVSSYKIGRTNQLFPNPSVVVKPCCANAATCLPAFQGLFFRLYYPCAPQDEAEQPSWIPRYEYYRGLADYMKMNRKWCAPLLSVTLGKAVMVLVQWDS